MSDRNATQTPMNEPIAIIGIGCRFPGGVNDLETFWQLLRDGVDAITEIPASRFDLDTWYDPRPATPGKVMTRFGGFLDAIDQMDAGFFGISPREAERLDPQQRLLMEVAWEALENAGQPAEKLSGSQTGVFIGQWLNDFEARLFADPAATDFYMTTGSGRYAASGRLSFLFGLQGPSLTLDTACSSSLVAVNLACHSLRSGECNMALAGAANVILQPNITIAYSQSKMMATDGRCKFGDASANGYVRSEGAAVLVLKRLSDARADGDPILALIRGSAVNNDGQSSGFLTTPGSAGQEEMLRKAYCNAGVQPGQVQYIEAHGTGTSAGDPVEIGALGAVLAEDRPADHPCLVGSVKTNFGHTEGAAGLAGLIKVVLALKHGQIPPSLHFHTPSAKIPWETLPLKVADHLQDWPEHTGPAIAGVSAFGITGTNAHVVLQEAPPQAAAQVAPLPTGTFLPLSARSPEALRAQAGRFAVLLRQGSAPLADVLYSASRRRSHHPYRLAAQAVDRDSLAQALEAYAQDDPAAPVTVGNAIAPRKVVFVFPGQGGQWLGMGRQLLASDPVFRRTIERCEEAFRGLVDWSLLEQIAADEAGSRMGEIDVVQPMLFAIQVALAESLRARGVQPDAVVGHSLGEVAAACVAGALSLEDAARVICTRSRLMRRVSGKGGMAVIGLSLEQTNALLEDYRDRLSAAVSNSPSSTVISGDPAALEEVMNKLRADNIFCRAVNVDVAAHSPHMDALRPELVAALAGIQPKPASVLLMSTAEGRPVDGATLDAEYWGRNLRQPVLFASAVQQLLAQGYTAFVECGPHPVLLTAVGQNSDSASAPVTLAAMRREEDEQAQLDAAVMGLYANGAPLDWSLAAPASGQVVPLPNYPWQRERYWVDTKTTQTDPLAGWFYQVQWKAAPRASASAAPAGNWLVFCEPGEDGLGAQLAGCLAALGAQVTRVIPGAQFGRDAQTYTIAADNPQHFRQLLDGVLARAGELDGVAFCWGASAPGVDALDTAGLESAQDTHLRGALHLVQSLATAAWTTDARPRLWLVTRDAQPVVAGRVSGLAQATLWGFGRVLAFEYPELWGGLVDTDGASLESVARELLGPGDQQVAFRRGRRFQARLARQSIVPMPDDELSFSPDAAYLITGGLGGLGLKVAAWMASRGARNLALMGRSRGTPAAQQAVEALEAQGVRILRVQGDASHMEDVERVLGEIATALPPLKGIIHSAGTLEDALLSKAEWPAYQRVMSSKVSGAWNLHRATEGLDLDLFVLFSSATALLGTPGQSNYAAANAFLDALAYARQAAGLPALSINWGGWSEVGLATQHERASSLAHIGLESFAPQKGLAALERALLQTQPQLAVMAMDWNRYAEQRPRGASAFYATSVSAQKAAGAAQETGSERASIAQQIEDADPRDRMNLISGQVAGVVARILRHAHPDSINRDQGFFQMGLDSLMAVELRNSLQKAFGRTLRSTLAFDFPSINSLSRYLYTEMFPQQTAAQPEPLPDAGAEEETLASLSRDEVKSLLDDELRMLEEDL